MMAPPRQKLLIASDTGDLLTVQQILRDCQQQGGDDRQDEGNDRLHANIRHCYSGRHYNNGVTPLMLACRSGHMDVCNALIQEFDARIDLCDAEDWTALHYSSFNGHDEICSLLLKKLQQKPHNETAYNDADIVQNMLELETKFEKATPENFARHRKYQKTVKVLQEAANSTTTTTTTEGEQPTTAQNEQLWIWTPEEQHRSLEKCLKKLQKARPKHKMRPGLFLFRYQLDMKNYNKLEHLLLRGLVACKERAMESTTVTDHMVVLDAVDILLDPHQYGGINSPVTEASAGRDTQEHEEETEKQKKKKKKKKHNVATKTNVVEKEEPAFGVPVKLIVHLDFDAHVQYRIGIQAATAIRSGEHDETIVNVVDGPRVLRSSSVSGMEHITVMLP